MKPTDIHTSTTIESALDLIAMVEIQWSPWDNDTKSRFIESMLMGLPMLPIVLDRTEDRAKVIDGNKRLEAISSFVSLSTDPLQLSGLEYFSDLNGKTYDYLEPRHQRRVTEKLITVENFDPGTTKEALQNIYRRYRSGHY